MFNFSKKATPEEMFTELQNKGWFELTPSEVLPEAEANLKDTLSREYVDTGVAYEETPFLQQRLNLGEDEYWIVSLDSRVFADDPETLTEKNGIVRFLNRVNAVMRMNNLQLFAEITDSIGYGDTSGIPLPISGDTDSFGLTISVDGNLYEIYSQKDKENFNWGLGVNGVVVILDSLLEKIGNTNRAYFSWGGDNDVRFYLLTDELFSYITEKKLDGGLGPILKKI